MDIYRSIFGIGLLLQAPGYWLLQTAQILVPIGTRLNIAGSNGQEDSGDCVG